MENQFMRTQLLLGEAGMKKLAESRVAVFGIGGVGGYTVEALARSGVGTLDLIDNDTVCVSNLNRQIIATYETVGMDKVDAAKERIRQIAPDAAVNVHKTFFLPETAEQFDFTQYDYVVDAIDTVTGKLEIIVRAQAAGVPVISCMGAGNKLDATAFRVADIYETSGCPLAKVMRRELKKTRHKNMQGGLFYGDGFDACRCRRSGNKRKLRTSGTRKRGVCACGSRADSGGRSGQGYRRKKQKMKWR